MNIYRGMFVVEIDNDTLEKIIETHNDVKHLVKNNEEQKKKIDKLDGRVRRIETWFLPLVAMVGIFANKIWSFLKI